MYDNVRCRTAMYCRGDDMVYLYLVDYFYALLILNKNRLCMTRLELMRCGVSFEEQFRMREGAS